MSAAEHSLALKSAGPNPNLLIIVSDGNPGHPSRGSSTLTIFISAPDRSLGQRGRLSSLIAAFELPAAELRCINRPRILNSIN